MTENRAGCPPPTALTDGHALTPHANPARAGAPSAEIAAIGGASSSINRPPALQGVRIPSRNATVRRAVVDLYRVCDWLSVADLPAATRWGYLFVRFRRLADVLDRLPPVKVAGGDAEPRKLDAELRAFSMEMGRLETQLGITVSARASLGVDVARMRKLAQAGDPAPEADVEALEARIVERLRGEEEQRAW